MMYSVFVCDNFTEDGKVLTIWNPKEVARVETIGGYEKVYDELMSGDITPNAIICPNLFNHGKAFTTILFR